MENNENSLIEEPLNPVFINFIIPLKNRGKFIRLLLHNIQAIVTNTNEKHIKVWIGDFGSTDIDLAEFIKEFNFPIEIVLFRGLFRIALALQETADHIKNPDELLYFCDGDSVFPNEICDRIRSNTIKNKQFYVPMVSKQAMNGKVISSEPPHGHGGTGNVGVYVDDFQKSGGWAIGYLRQEGPGSQNPMSRVQWGKHDTHIYHQLFGLGLTPIRPRELDQWIRYHQPHMGWGK